MKSSRFRTFGLAVTVALTGLVGCGEDPLGDADEASGGSGGDGIGGAGAADNVGGSGGDGGGDCSAPADCDDGDACTEDLCSAGSCSHVAVDIDDADLCTTDSCDPLTGVAHADSGDDSDACTTDACDPVTGIVTHTPIDPDDMDICTTDTCDPITGASNEPLPTVTLLSENFDDNSAGWTLGPEWGIGAATASEGHSGGCNAGDPSADHTGNVANGVAGAAIGGNIADELHDYYYLTSPVMDASGLLDVQLTFWRHLNSDYTPFMQNVVEVFDGTDWQPLWASGESPGTKDSEWVEVTYDLSAYANAAMQVRMGFNLGSDGAYICSGWNIDDVEIGASCL